MPTPEQRAKNAAYMKRWNEQDPTKRQRLRLAAKARRDADPALKAAFTEQRKLAARRQRAARVDLRIKDALRSRVRVAVHGYKRGSRKAGGAVRDLGCSVGELMAHLEKQFQPGMTMENYGEWEIDHVQPLSSFDLTDESQFKEAANYKNLQPLWKLDNRKKGCS